MAQFQPHPAETLAFLAAKGYRQKELAELCGTTQATISRIANGKIVDPKHTLSASIEHLRLSLLGGRDDG